MHPWVGLSDHVRLGAVARWVTPELVAEALDDCGVRDKKPGALPAGFMVYFTLGLALFQQDSCDDVAEHMVGGVPELGESIPNRSSFTRARQRLGAPAIERVFRKLTGPLAPAGLEGSFYRGMRLAAVDGFVLDAPETEANRRRLGGPKDARGQVAGFPQVRVVTLTETGTHAQIDAAVEGACCGEPELAIRLAPAAAGMLVIMDRGFPGVALWRAYTEAGAHLLIRARSCVVFAVAQDVHDGDAVAGVAGAWKAPPGWVPGGAVVDAVSGWWSVWRGGFFGDGGAGGGFVDDGFAGGAGGEQGGDGQPVDRAGQAAGVAVDDAHGVVGEQGVGPARLLRWRADVPVGLGGGERGAGMW